MNMFDISVVSKEWILCTRMRKIALTKGGYGDASVRFNGYFRTEVNLRGSSQGCMYNSWWFWKIIAICHSAFGQKVLILVVGPKTGRGWASWQSPDSIRKWIFNFQKKQLNMLRKREGKYIYWEISIDANHRLLLFSSKYRRTVEFYYTDSFCGSRRISYIVLSFQLFSSSLPVCVYASESWNWKSVALLIWDYYITFRWILCWCCYCQDYWEWLLLNFSIVFSINISGNIYVESSSIWEELPLLP